MLTQDRIEQVRRQTNVSTMDAIHALTISSGDVDRAVEELNDHAQRGNRAIVAQTCIEAQRLACALVVSGIWFECEATSAGTWRFSVALGAFARLRSLYEAVLIDSSEKLAIAA